MKFETFSNGLEFLFQVKALNNKRFVTSSFDQSMVLWNAEDGKLCGHFRGNYRKTLHDRDPRNSMESYSYVIYI